MATPAEKATDSHDLGFLRDEATRIKQSLYAQYGPQIEAMMSTAQRDAAGQRDGEGRTQIDKWQDQIDALLAYQKPLRQQIKQCQQEAIQKLVEAAEENQRRGISVDDRLAFLKSFSGVDAAAHPASGPC